MSAKRTGFAHLIYLYLYTGDNDNDRVRIFGLANVITDLHCVILGEMMFTLGDQGFRWRRIVFDR